MAMKYSIRTLHLTKIYSPVRYLFYHITRKTEKYRIQFDNHFKLVFRNIIRLE